MDITLLSRWQFAITTVYHFLFVPVTLGLSIFVALLETCYVKTKRPEWKGTCKKLTKFFGTLFLINFAMGVATGIVQEFQFGMNWSEYSRFMGDIFGAPLALEALSAFFLESTFLGLWMFGWDKLSEKAHCACIWLVALGSNISAFWILCANSFMQHPVGYVINNGRAEMTDFAALITNRYLIGEFSHTLTSAIGTAGFIVMMVCIWKIFHDKKSAPAFMKVLKYACVYCIAGVVLTMGAGHMHTQYMGTVQPMKIASMEALWETEDPAPFAIVAVPNVEQKKNDFEIAVPGLFSMMMYNKPAGEIKGINAIQKEYCEKYGGGNYIPDVTGLFISFRTMIGVGGAMVGLAAIVFLLAWKKKLMDFKGILKFLPCLAFLPYLANTAGWFIAEAGRQPWIVVGLQKTGVAVSPNLTPTELYLSIGGFVLVYMLLIVAMLYIAFRYIKNHTVEEGGAE